MTDYVELETQIFEQWQCFIKSTASNTLSWLLRLKPHTDVIGDLRPLWAAFTSKLVVRVSAKLLK